MMNCAGELEEWRQQRGGKDGGNRRPCVITARASQERARAPSGASHAGGCASKRERWRGLGQTVHDGEGGRRAAAGSTVAD